MGPPSGDRLEIAFADQRVAVDALGGGLRTYVVDGRDVVDGYGPTVQPTAGRGQLLVPWPNRLAGGSYELSGRRHQLPVTEPDRGNAIHGLVRGERWLLAGHEPHRLVLAHELRPRPGYPFPLALEVEYSLSAGGLAVRVAAMNTGTEPCPYGAGAHPYLCPGVARVDDASLRIPADLVLESDDRGIPVSSRRVSGTELDFREPRPIGATRLDHCFTALTRDADRLARIAFAGLELWADDAFAYVMVYSGDASPDVSRRSLAVEPMTCAPNAFNSGDGLVVLDPGEGHTATWGLTVV